MKKILIIILSLIFSSSLFLTNLYSIDLVALSKKEKERRKKLKSKTKIVITDATLKKYKNKKVSFTIINKKPEDKKNIKKNNQENENKTNRDENSKEAYWRNRKRILEANITFLKGEIKSTQLELNKVTTDYNLTEMPLKKNQLNNKRIELIKKLEKLKISLKKAEKALEDFKDEARRKGIPPGWIR